MLKVLAAFGLADPASLKRALSTVFGGVAILLINPLLVKWGMPPVDDSVLAIFAGLLATFILQSGANSMASKAAAAKVTAAEVAPLPASVSAPTFVVETGAPARPAALDPNKTVTP